MIEDTSLRKFRIVAIAGGRRRLISTQWADSPDTAVEELMDKHSRRGTSLELHAVTETRC